MFNAQLLIETANPSSEQMLSATWERIVQPFLKVSLLFFSGKEVRVIFHK
jgi:hypothetical protein|tara:strand:+ start:676 stop:825 length:150 start_codon:yes stop_codon:yes gene_type:complete